MPDITISEQQAAALARGENITIEPPREELHNVALYVGKQVYFVWDGFIEGDHVHTLRYQRLVDVFGEPVQEPVRDESLYFAERAKIKKIVQVGA